MYRILVIDDEPSLRTIVVDALKLLNYQVDIATDGLAGIRKIYETKPDLVLLDVLIPGLDGWQICQRVRLMCNIPLIIISALDSDDDVAKGLTMGADDYLIKPIPIAELRVRVKAALRRRYEYGSRSFNTFATVLEYQGLKIDCDERRVTYQDEPVHLAHTEYNLLTCLIKHKNQTLPSEYLLASVWGNEYGENIDVLRLYISYLRKKLKICGAPEDMIHTVWGIGYRLD